MFNRRLFLKNVGLAAGGMLLVPPKRIEYDSRGNRAIDNHTNGFCEACCVRYVSQNGGGKHDGTTPENSWTWREMEQHIKPGTWLGILGHIRSVPKRPFDRLMDIGTETKPLVVFGAGNQPSVIDVGVIDNTDDLEPIYAHPKHCTSLNFSVVGYRKKIQKPSSLVIGVVK